MRKCSKCGEWFTGLEDLQWHYRFKHSEWQYCPYHKQGYHNECEKCLEAKSKLLNLDLMPTGYCVECPTCGHLNDADEKGVRACEECKTEYYVTDEVIAM